MRVLDRLPRPTQRELEELAQARRDLDSVYDTIHGTNLQAKPALEGHLVGIAGVLDRFLQKRLAFIAKARERESTQAPSEASAEIGAGEQPAEGSKTAPG